MDILNTFKHYENSRIKLYRKIYNSVVKSIESGSLKTSTKLPSIRALSKTIGASKNSITKAYDLLEKEGYIYSVPKSGYYTKSPNEEVFINTKEESKKDQLLTVDSIYKERESSGDIFDSKSILKNSKTSSIFFSDNFSKQLQENSILKASDFESKKSNTVFLSSGDIYTREIRDKNTESLDFYIKQSFDNVLKNQRERLNHASEAFGDESLKISFAAFLFKETNIDINPSDLIIDSGIENQLRNILSLPFIKDLQEKNSFQKKNKGLLKAAEEMQTASNKRKVSVMFAKDPGENIKNIFEKAGFNCFKSDAAFEENGLEIMEENNVLITFISPLDIIGRPQNQISIAYKNINNWIKDKNHILIEHDSTLLPKKFRDIYPTIKTIESNSQIIFIKTFESIFSKGLNSSCTILPKNLFAEYKKEYECYGCPLPLINQLILSNLIISGNLYTYLKNLTEL